MSGDGTLPVGDTKSLSLLYHLNSEPWLNEAAYELGAGHEPLLESDGRPVVALPAGGESPLVDSQRRRRSCRSFAPREMPLATLAALLAGTQGIVEIADVGFARRATPSAGGLFPLDAYVFAQRVVDLPEGLYRYHQLGHALAEIDRKAVPERLAASLYAYPFVAEANVLMALAARFDRTQEKYGPRGYRYILLEAGHCAQNACLRAVELGLSTLCIGGFADSVINTQLGVDSARGGVVYVIAAGYAA
jgi:SagB-type dehydrogenase family enzyme